MPTSYSHGPLEIPCHHSLAGPSRPDGRDGGSSGRSSPRYTVGVRFGKVVVREAPEASDHLRGGGCCPWGERSTGTSVLWTRQRPSLSVSPEGRPRPRYSGASHLTPPTSLFRRVRSGVPVGPVSEPSPYRPSDCFTFYTPNFLPPAPGPSVTVGGRCTLLCVPSRHRYLSVRFLCASGRAERSSL